MVGQSASFGCCRRVMAKAAWILTLGNLSVTRTSMAWWMRSNRSSSIWAFSAILPSNLLISWHTRKRTAWLLALWDWGERKAGNVQSVWEAQDCRYEEGEEWTRGRAGQRKMSCAEEERAGGTNRWSPTGRERRQMGQDKTRLKAAKTSITERLYAANVHNKLREGKVSGLADFFKKCLLQMINIYLLISCGYSAHRELCVNTFV